MLEPQNFTVWADNGTTINIDIDPDNGVTLVGSTILFRVYEQAFGEPIPGVDPVIVKSNAPGGIVVTDPDKQQLAVTIDAADVVALLRNYYWEATVIDPGSDPVTIGFGIMTVGGTENRVA